MDAILTREECDKLTNIIKSRVVGSPTIGGMELGRLNETPNRAGGSGVAFINLDRHQISRMNFSAPIVDLLCFLFFRC